jgi:hypothetical protein
MIERRPTERLVTADDLPDRDMWYDPEELYPYMDAQDAAIQQLRRERDEAVGSLKRAVIAVSVCVRHLRAKNDSQSLQMTNDLTAMRDTLARLEGGQDETRKEPTA